MISNILTRDEITKALKCCQLGTECQDCPLYHYKDGTCTNEMLKAALGLIYKYEEDIIRYEVKLRAAEQTIHSQIEDIKRLEEWKERAIKDF